MKECLECNRIATKMLSKVSLVNTKEEGMVRNEIVIMSKLRSLKESRDRPMSEHEMEREERDGCKIVDDGMRACYFSLVENELA